MKQKKRNPHPRKGRKPSLTVHEKKMLKTLIDEAKNEPRLTDADVARLEEHLAEPGMSAGV